MKQFVDFRKYLQEKIDAIISGVFSVATERNLNSDFIDGEVVVSAMAGAVYEDSATIPYEIDIFTSDPEGAIDYFTALAKENNNKPFQTIINEGTADTPDFKQYTIIPYFQTPVTMDKGLAYGTDHYAKVVMFANLVILFQVSNVASITIDGEEIKFIDGSFSYATELQSSRVSGVELNKSKKKAATISLNFKMINKDTLFSRNIWNVMIGNKPGNTSFSVTITLTNGMSATLKMLLNTNVLAFARQQLSTDNISLFLYDDRGDNNNA